MDANISTIELDYEFVSLKNQGPAKVTFRRKQISISQANLQGADSDFHIAGSARFDGTRPVNLDVSGKVNLQLLAGLLPDLHARGGADVRVVVEGTMSNPLITGRVGFTDASLSYADFPTGLSHLKGDIVFDRTQALFDNLHAQTGGGDLTLSGSMSYGDGPLRYQLDAVAPQVRVRYPVGMSWLVGGTLHLTGRDGRGDFVGERAGDAAAFCRGRGHGYAFDRVVGERAGAGYYFGFFAEFAIRFGRDYGTERAHAMERGAGGAGRDDAFAGDLGAADFAGEYSFAEWRDEFSRE